MWNFSLKEERVQIQRNINSGVLRVHLHNSLAHLACYPLPRKNCSSRSSAMSNVIFEQLITKSSPSSSDLPPNSSFDAGAALRQTLPDQTCTVLPWSCVR